MTDFGKSKLNVAKKESEFSGLEPLVNINMTDLVEDKLRNYFIQKKFKAGDTIPKEVELAASLNVSRSIVREALSRLKMLGMIESRKRRGMILTEPDIWSGFTKIIDSKLLSEHSLKELLELRLVIEMGVSELLFIRRNDTDLEALEKVVVTEEKNAKTPADHARYDVEFHKILYHMSGNETLYRFQKMLGYVFNYIVGAMSTVNEKDRAVSVSHRDLLNILKNGDPRAFQEAMHKHLEPYYRFLL